MGMASVGASQDESGDVVFALYSPESPVTVKFYGKIEKIN